MDMENYVKKSIKNKKTKDEIINELSKIIQFYKNLKIEESVKLAKAVYNEVITTNNLQTLDILEYTESNVHMGEFGVGSRGKGDFYVHSKIAEIIKNTKVDSIVNPTAQDDGGVVTIDKDTSYITTAIDGIHSRLGDYPFLAGFHTARATLRDVCVMGAKPVALISDIHLADDGDVAKILDYTAGICAVSELTGIPLVSGSTLRVGGDMVLGDRLVGGVGAVGTSQAIPTARSRAEKDDVIIMTEGSGGGTITTTAIYNNYPEVIQETLNVQFIKASNFLNTIENIHAMTDITNGGIRGDSNEINNTTGLGIHLFEEKIINLINPDVYNMLKELKIDPLGVSIDSIMIITSKDDSKKIIEGLSKINVKSNIIGFVTDTGNTILEDKNGNCEIISPEFREAAYTPLKNVVDSLDHVEFDVAKECIDKATESAVNKKDEIVRWINNKYE